MADVGHGLSLAFQFYDSNFHIDCGGDKNRYKKAYLNLLCNDPEIFILSHFHSDHYNALAYAKNNKLPKTNIEKLYFPRIPDGIIKKTEFLRCLLTINYFILGNKTGSMELDLINLIQSLSNRIINFKPVSQGDIIENGIEILWPPRRLVEENINSQVKNAIAEFERIKKRYPVLDEIYEKIKTDNYFQEGNFKADDNKNNLDNTSNKNLNNIEIYIYKEIRELNKTFRKVANYFSVAFRLDNDILFMGDLEESDIGIILENIEKDGNHYRVLITPHHGTHWNDNFYKFHFKYAISSEGSKYFGYLKPGFGRVSSCFKCTYLCGDIALSDLCPFKNNCNNFCFKCCRKWWYP